MKQLTLIATLAFAVFTFNACSTKAYADDYGTTNTATAKKVVVKANTAIGEVFATAKGLTLYTFSKDDSSVSNCYDACAANWPPFSAKKEAKIWGNFSIIERKDGSYQWAFKNQPLYTWVGDRNFGDINGQGIGNVWYAAQPAM